MVSRPMWELLFLSLMQYACGGACCGASPLSVVTVVQRTLRPRPTFPHVSKSEEPLIHMSNTDRECQAKVSLQRTERKDQHQYSWNVDAFTSALIPQSS